MGVPEEEPREPVLVCGEIRTGLLRTHQSLPAAGALELLRLRADERVRVSERPNLHAVSPDVLTGVDCRLATASGAKVRVVGTVAAHAVLTEGRVLQTTAYYRAPAKGPEQRQPWDHYLVRPGVIEPLGRLPARDAAEAFLTGQQRPGELDLGTIAEQLLGNVMRHPLLDQSPPFKSGRTRLRWTALPSGAPGQAPAIQRFTLATDGLRTVELRVPKDTEPAAIAGLCEDLALHDWLLTTLVRMVERSRLGSVDGHGAVMALRPAVDHLLHLWMPKARVDRALGPLWEVLEREPGFTRQWQTLVQRIRDQLALQAIPLLREALTAR
ncbi:SCO2521 family protein [Streptomyces sp. NPDC127084]|uniref:SCO2521 family protein n=1 Tax=Streptomyces sp. NPDC127084 TaxID=3347133 RepID=UPI00364CC51B